MLARSPGVLLLDEPLAALDARTRASASRELAAVLNDARVPALLVTHDFAEAAQLGDRVGVIDAGQIIQEGTPTELAAAPRSAFVADFTGAVVLNGNARSGPDGLTLITLDGGGEIASTDDGTGRVPPASFPGRSRSSPWRSHRTARRRTESSRRCSRSPRWAGVYGWAGRPAAVGGGDNTDLCAELGLRTGSRGGHLESGGDEARRPIERKISARNKLSGTVSGIRRGEAIANVEPTRGQRLVASITVEAVGSPNGPGHGGRAWTWLRDPIRAQAKSRPMADRYDPKLTSPSGSAYGPTSTPGRCRTRLRPSSRAYILEMLPYPSGEPHIGYLKTYSVGDGGVLPPPHGRSCLHPMGYDAFGLPAENHAIKTAAPARPGPRLDPRVPSRSPASGVSRSTGTRNRHARAALLPRTQWIFPRLLERPWPISRRRR